MIKRYCVITILITLFIPATVATQTYACSMLSVSMSMNGEVRKKSYAVNSLYISFYTDSIKLFGNYEGRYLSKVFDINRRNRDTLFVNSDLLGEDKEFYLVHTNNSVISNYNFISGSSETSISVHLTLKPVQNHFSEKYHEKKEQQQSSSHPRDLLGRELK